MLRIAATPRTLVGRGQSIRVDGAWAVSAARLAAAGGVLFAAAYLLWQFVDPGSATILLGLVLAGLAARRWPSRTMIAAFVVDSAYGSLKAFFNLPANGLATIALTGLLVATLGGYVFGRRDRATVVWPAVAPIVLYLFVTLMMLPFAPAVDPAFKVVRTAGLYMLAPLLIAYGPWRRGTHERVRSAVIVVALLVGAYATLRWGIGASAKEKAQVTASAFNQVGSQSKVQGSFPSGVELGVWASVMIPFLLGCALTMRGRLRILAAVALPLCAIGLLGSELRIGLVAALAGSALVLVAFGLGRGMPASRLGVVAGVVLAIAAAGIVLFPTVIGHDANSVQRYRNILSPSRDSSYQGRIDKWRQALVDIRGHPFGYGLATIGPESVQQRFLSNTNTALDSSYLRIAYEQGLAVMVLFISALIFLLVGLLRRGIWTRARRRAGPAISAAGTLAALALVMVGEMVTTEPATLPAWIIIGLGIAPFTRLEAPAQMPSARS